MECPGIGVFEGGGIGEGVLGTDAPVVVFGPKGFVGGTNYTDGSAG